MTKLLEEAIAKLKTLDDEQQDRVAGLLLHLAEGEVEFELTQEQIEGIELAVAQADAGEFATEEEVARALRRPWA
jgi:predicted transcriptional regulator